MPMLWNWIQYAVFCFVTLLTDSVLSFVNWKYQTVNLTGWHLFCLQVIDLSQYSPTYFGPEHAQVLSSHLLHSSLPGLTRMEQMSLMALADTIASTSIDLNDSQGKSKGTAEKW